MNAPEKLKTPERGPSSNNAQTPPEHLLDGAAHFIACQALLPTLLVAHRGKWFFRASWGSCEYGGSDSSPLSHNNYRLLSKPRKIAVCILAWYCVSVLLTSKKWRLQREGRQSRRQSVEMKSDWLFDKSRSNYWLRVAASNPSSQSPCLAGVTQSHYNPQ